MFERHVTHLLTRYVNGTLRPKQRARVVNHVRTCDACRAALAREERLARDLRRELPHVGTPRPGQLAAVWAGVMREINAPRERRVDRSTVVSGLSLMIALALAVVLALPLMADDGVRVEAAPQQARPVSTASPTPGVTETGEARAAAPLVAQPQATIAFVSAAGMTPAPVPQVTVSPEVVRGGARW